MTSRAIVGAFEGGLSVVTRSTLDAGFNFFHGDGFGALPHDREDAGLVTFAATLSVRLPLEGNRPVLSVGPGQRAMGRYGQCRTGPYHAHQQSPAKQPYQSQNSLP